MRFTRMLVAFALFAAAQEALPPAAAASFNPRAIELFERDWVLNQWAKGKFDANGDGIISVAEAQPPRWSSSRSRTATATAG